MKTKKIIAALTLSLLSLSSSYAMFDENNNDSMNKTAKNEIKVMKMVETSMDETKEIAGWMMERWEGEGKEMMDKGERWAKEMMEKWEEKGKEMMDKGEKWAREMMERWEKKGEEMMDKGEKWAREMMERWEKKGEEMMDKMEKIKQMAWKKAEKADNAMKNFEKRFENNSKSEKIAQYKKLDEKINRVMEKYLNSDISEAKKESYKNLFEYIRTLNEEKMTSLEVENETVIDTTDIK